MLAEYLGRYAKVKGFVCKRRVFQGSLKESEQAILGTTLGSVQIRDTGGYIRRYWGAPERTNPRPGRI